MVSSAGLLGCPAGDAGGGSESVSARRGRASEGTGSETWSPGGRGARVSAPIPNKAGDADANAPHAFFVLSLTSQHMPDRPMPRRATIVSSSVGLQASWAHREATCCYSDGSARTQAPRFTNFYSNAFVHRRCWIVDYTTESLESTLCQWESSKKKTSCDKP